MPTSVVTNIRPVFHKYFYSYSYLCNFEDYDDNDDDDNDDNDDI